MRITVPLVKPLPKTLSVPPLSVEMRFGSMVVTLICGKGVGDCVAVAVGLTVAVDVGVAPTVLAGVIVAVFDGVTVAVTCRPGTNDRGANLSVPAASWASAGSVKKQSSAAAKAPKTGSRPMVKRFILEICVAACRSLSLFVVMVYAHVVQNAAVQQTNMAAGDAQQRLIVGHDDDRAPFVFVQLPQDINHILARFAI